jgi:hypothetical protein
MPEDKIELRVAMEELQRELLLKLRPYENQQITPALMESMKETMLEHLTGYLMLLISEPEVEVVLHESQGSGTEIIFDMTIRSEFLIQPEEGNADADEHLA